MLTFNALEQQIEALSSHPSASTTLNKRARWGYWMVFGAGALDLIVARVLPPSLWTLALAVGLFAIEITGIALLGFAQALALNLNPGKERREFADTLDFDMPHHEALVQWLRQFPRKRLLAMSA